MNLQKILELLSPSTQEMLRVIIRNIAGREYIGNKRHCTVCEREAKMFTTIGSGDDLRIDAACPWCSSLERHRFTWQYMKEQTNLFDGKPKTMLHIAPEKSFSFRLEKILDTGYISADLDSPHAKIKMDITDIHYPDEFFDIVYCSHVLEHVSDDRKAMREFYRVLKKSGWALIQVPVEGKVTFEDPSITEPKERLRVFGQDDHVRIYGPDIVDRLQAAGFQVNVISIQDVFDKSTRTTMGLTAACGDIYFCTR